MCATEVIKTTKEQHLNMYFMENRRQIVVLQLKLEYKVSLLIYVFKYVHMYVCRYRQLKKWKITL